MGVVMPSDVNQQIVTGKPENQQSGRDGWLCRRYPAGMDSLGARLKHAREAAGLTQAELAERVGMAGQSGIEAIESGRSKRPTRIHEIAKACGVTVEWLQGREESAPLKNRADRAVVRTPSPQDISGLDHLEMPADRSRSLPELDLRGGASYGGGKADEEWQDGNVSGDKPIAHWGLPSSFVQRELGLQYGFADVLQVRGDSMDDGSAKGLASGDRVIVDRRDTDTRQGGIFVVNDGEGVIIKQVELLRGHEPPRIICKSLNPRYDPITLILDGSVVVIGRVAGVISRR